MIGAFGLLILILFLVSVLLLVMVITSRKKKCVHVQVNDGTDRSTTLLSLANNSCLSYYDDPSAVTEALKADRSEEDALRRADTSDSVSDKHTGASYVPVPNILDAKHLWKTECLDEMLETYEDMNGLNSDTIRSQSAECTYSLEMMETYEVMTAPVDMKLPQRGKVLCSLDEGWEEDYEFNDTHNEGDTTLVKKLNEQRNKLIAGQHGHEIDKNLKESVAVAVTDASLEYYVECDRLYDDINEADDIYAEVDEVVPSVQPAGQSVQQPTIPPAKELSEEQQGSLSDKCPCKKTARQPLGKSSPHYQPLCLPHSLGDNPEEYTKLHLVNPERRAVTLEGSLSRQHSSMREPSHSNRADGEVRPPSHWYTSVKKPSRCPDTDGLGRPPSHQNSPTREPSHREA